MSIGFELFSWDSLESQIRKRQNRIREEIRQIFPSIHRRPEKVDLSSLYEMMTQDRIDKMARRYVFDPVVLGEDGYMDLKSVWRKGISGRTEDMNLDVYMGFIGDVELLKWRPDPFHEPCPAGSVIDGKGSAGNRKLRIKVGFGSHDSPPMVEHEYNSLMRAVRLNVSSSGDMVRRHNESLDNFIWEEFRQYAGRYIDHMRHIRNMASAFGVEDLTDVTWNIP